MANGLLGKQVSQTNQFVLLYEVPATGVEFATVTIHVLNMHTDIAQVDVAITNAATPTDADFIGYKDELVAEGGVVEYNCYTVSPGEKIYMRSNNNRTTGRVHGLEKPDLGA